MWQPATEPARRDAGREGLSPALSAVLEPLSSFSWWPEDEVKLLLRLTRGSDEGRRPLVAVRRVRLCSYAGGSGPAPPRREEMTRRP